MRTFPRRPALLAGVILALYSLLAACGVTPISGATSTPGTPVVMNGTSTSDHALGTPSQWPPSTTTPTVSSAATAGQGAVRLVLDKTSYAPGSSAVVTIENGLRVKIMVTDHHTDCKFVQLEQLYGDGWKPVGTCPLMTVTRLVDLGPGSVTPQIIGIPSGPGAEGTYRVMLAYIPAGLGSPSGQSGPAYSPTFTVG